MKQSSFTPSPTAAEHDPQVIGGGEKETRYRGNPRQRVDYLGCLTPQRQAVFLGSILGGEEFGTVDIAFAVVGHAFGGQSRGE